MKNSSTLPRIKIKKMGESSFVLDHCLLANTSKSRLIGLLGKASLAPNEALLIDPCNQIHMFFMKFAIDAFFLDQQNKIVAVESLKPWRLSKLYFKAKKVLEVPYGFSEKLGWKKGDCLEFFPDLQLEVRHD